MPNIQICGFFFAISFVLGGRGISAKIEGRAFEARDKIEQVLKDMNLGGESIVEIIPTVATSCDGERLPMPYLRVCDTNPERMRQIVRALKEANIGMDVEELQLAGFTEAKDMKV